MSRDRRRTSYHEVRVHEDMEHNGARNAWVAYALLVQAWDADPANPALEGLRNAAREARSAHLCAKSVLAQVRADWLSQSRRNAPEAA